MPFYLQGRANVAVPLDFVLASESRLAALSRPTQCFWGYVQQTNLELESVSPEVHRPRAILQDRRLLSIKAGGCENLAWRIWAYSKQSSPGSSRARKRFSHRLDTSNV